MKEEPKTEYTQRNDFAFETVVRFLKKALVYAYGRRTLYNDIDEALKQDELIKKTLRKGAVFYEFYSHFPFVALNDYFRKDDFTSSKIKLVPVLDQALLNAVADEAALPSNVSTCFVIVECLSDSKRVKRPSENLQIWGFNTLYSLLKPYFELNRYEGDPILELLGRRDIIESRGKTSSTHLTDDRIKEAEKEILEELKEEVRNNPNFKLVLGNGLSIPFGAKSWSKLVDQIYGEVAKVYLGHSPFISKGAFNEDTYAITEIAELKLYSDKKRNDYYKLLYQGIYGEFDLNGQKPLLTKDRSLYNGVVSLMKRHKGLKAVTFNYDEYLEMGLLSSDLSSFSFPYFLTGSFISNKEVTTRIAHIHGKMPYHHHGYKSDDVSKTSFILTETEYLSFYGNRFNGLTGDKEIAKWQKESLDKALGDSFLMLGLSFRDIYLRRAIYESKDSLLSKGRELPKRYIFLSSMVSIAGQLCKLTYDDRMMLKIYFDSFGITPLFFDTYKEMQETLEGI